MKRNVYIGLFVLFLALLIRFGDRIQKFKVHDSGIIVITGATSGLGLDAAIRFAEMGYTVLAGAKSKKKAQSLKEQTHLPNLIPIVLDVTNPYHIQNCFNTVSKMNEPLVGLVNNAGVGPLHEMAPNYTEEHGRKIFDVNFFAVLSLTQKLYPLLKKSKGRVVNMCSAAGHISIPGYAMYASSKFACRALSDAFRMEFLEDGVSVSFISPGYVASNMCPEAKCQGLTAADYTTPAFVHAITNPRPSSDYQVSNVDMGTPAWVFIKLHELVPTKIFDLVVLNAQE